MAQCTRSSSPMVPGLPREWQNSKGKGNKQASMWARNPPGRLNNRLKVITPNSFRPLQLASLSASLGRTSKFNGACFLLQYDTTVLRVGRTRTAVDLSPSRTRLPLATDLALASRHLFVKAKAETRKEGMGWSTWPELLLLLVHARLRPCMVRHRNEVFRAHQSSTPCTAVRVVVRLTLIVYL